MTKKQFADTVGKDVGFDPTIILTIISFLLPLIQEWCKPKNKDVAKGQIDDEYRRLKLVKIGRKKGDKCPKRFKSAFKQGGDESFEKRDDIWASMVDNGFQNVSAVAGALVK